MVSRAQRPVLNAAVPRATRSPTRCRRRCTPPATARLGLTDWSYAAHDVGADELAAFVAGLDETWRGLSLTMPLKEVAFDVAAHGVAHGPGHRRDQHPGAPRRPGLGRAQHRRPRASRRHWPRSTTTEPRPCWAAVPRPGPPCSRCRSLGVDRVAAGAARRGTPRDAAAGGARRGGRRGRAAGHVGRDRGDRLVVSTLPPGRCRRRGVVPAGRRLQGTLMDVVYADWPTPLARRPRSRPAGRAGARHARLPGGRAVPPLHRAPRHPCRRCTPPAARRWAAEVGLRRGGVRRGGGLVGAGAAGPAGAAVGGYAGVPSPPAATGSSRTSRSSHCGTGGGRRLVLAASGRSWAGASATWPAGPRCRHTCSSPGSPWVWSGSTPTCTGCPTGSCCRPTRHCWADRRGHGRARAVERPVARPGVHGRAVRRVLPHGVHLARVAGLRRREAVRGDRAASWAGWASRTR